jgi:hypothetical protein
MQIAVFCTAVYTYPVPIKSDEAITPHRQYNVTHKVLLEAEFAFFLFSSKLLLRADLFWQYGNAINPMSSHQYSHPATQPLFYAVKLEYKTLIPATGHGIHEKSQFPKVSNDKRQSQVRDDVRFPSLPFERTPPSRQPLRVSMDGTSRWRSLYIRASHAAMFWRHCILEMKGRTVNKYNDRQYESWAYLSLKSMPDLILRYHDA